MVQYKGGCVVHEHTRISRYLKQELAWAIDIWLQVIINTMLFKTSYTTKNIMNKVENNTVHVGCGP